MAATIAEMNAKEASLTEALLDYVAEQFDRGEVVHPEDLIEVGKYHLSAGSILRCIRLHESLVRLEVK